MSCPAADQVNVVLSAGHSVNSPIRLYVGCSGSHFGTTSQDLSDPNIIEYNAYNDLHCLRRGISLWSAALAGGMRVCIAVVRSEECQAVHGRGGPI